MKDYAELIALYERYYAELNKEEYLASAGLKSKCDTQSISARFERVLSRRTYDHIADLIKRSRSAANKERFQRMAWAIMEGIVNGECPSDDIVNAELKARATIDGERISYFDLDVAIAKETDFDKREVLSDAKYRIVERTLNPLLKEESDGRIEAYRKFSGFLNMREYMAQAKSIDFDALQRALIWLAVESDAPYRSAMSAYAEERLGRPWRNIDWYAHHEHLFWPNDFDDLFPKERLTEVCAKTCAGLGLHFADAPNLFLDTEERPNKDSRAFCMGIRVPQEVRLVVKPRPGIMSYADFMHEAGHAWHFALTDPKLPYEFRNLQRSDSLTETYAFLFEFVTADMRWLTEIAGVPERKARELNRMQRMYDMAMLRRYVGKLCYELEQAVNPTDHEWNRRRYGRILSDLTGFVFRDARFLSDMDGGIHSADYLRAWIAEAHLRAHLVRTFGEDWFRKKEAGEFLRGCWKKGESISVEDLLKEIGADINDVAPLLRRFSDK